jgi:hypothetical protein
MFDALFDRLGAFNTSLVLLGLLLLILAAPIAHLIELGGPGRLFAGASAPLGDAARGGVGCSVVWSRVIARWLRRG